MALEQFEGGGAYDSNKIKNALTYLKDIEGQFKEGKLSQTDYTAKLKEVVPDARKFVDSLLGKSSHAVNVAHAAGSDQIFDFLRDMNIYQSGQELLGRDLTTQEFAQLKPRFRTGYGRAEDDFDTGRSYVAELAGQEAKSPAALRKKSGQFAGQVGETFQTLLGRAPTASETEHFGSLLATGEISPYEIEGLVKRTPEYQTQEDVKFRGDLSGELLGYEQEAFGKAQEDILGRLKRSGVTASEEATAAALAGASKDLESERQRYLSSLTAEQYGGNKALAVGQYQDILDQFLGQQAYGQQRSDAYLDYLTQRSDSTADYNRQMNDYLSFLSNQPKQKKSGLGGMVGTLAGGLLALPTGGLSVGAGAALGGAGGGLFDYLMG